MSLPMNLRILASAFAFLRSGLGVFMLFALLSLVSQATPMISEDTEPSLNTPQPYTTMTG